MELNNIKLITFSLIVLVILSCKDTNNHIGSVSDKFLNSFLKEKFKSNSFNKKTLIVIIPNSGCSGCINNIENTLLKKNFYNKANVLVIFTNIGDYKLLKNRYNNTKILELKNVFIDKNNELRNNGFVSFYPEVIILKNNKIKERQFLEPNNKNSVFLLNDFN